MRVELHNVRVPVFCCMWVDNNNGFRVYELGSMQVDLNRPGYKDGPFILASQTRQVFYVSNPANRNDVRSTHDSVFAVITSGILQRL
ncbi:hypothetical protein Lal_00020826 [Lupinus albus]|nr:hypothetical protein Lal_00020826 [Lupinus albus]